MPNYVRNIVQMKGIAYEPLYVDDNGCKRFDFNKLIPMPESLNIESGSMTDEGIVYFLTERCSIPLQGLTPEKKLLVNTLVHNMFAGSNWPEEIFRRVMARANDETEEERQRLYDAGKIYVSNYELYGATTWYGWRCGAWGTKWNACETVIIDDDTIAFDTAWSNPWPILLKMAEMYPDRTISHWWADEDMGSNTGYRFLQGEVSCEELYDQDDKALELYAKCWGEDSDCLYRDDNNVLHHRDCDECNLC